MPLINVAGRKVYYESHGPTSGTPLVLVMGMGGSCKGWLPLQVPEFSQRHRTLIFDNRGVGESEDPGGPFTTADLADDLAGLLHALGITRAHVLGAFLGGMAAQQFALRHPDLLGRLVLVGTWARPDAKRRLLLEKWRAMARSGVPREIFVSERLLWTLQDETLEQRDLIDAMSASFPGEGAGATGDLLARQCDACLGHDVLDQLRNIPHRTLVICGRNDQLTPPKMHRELADELHNARLATLYGAHLVMAEAAQQLNQAVLHFLAER
ncbi:MAG: alpha/beta fold hydrolase [Deltaproteobacteria bacterium]|nr:alpha/beta fold hydrolase [Deltaproteobacteria bacterium]